MAKSLVIVESPAKAATLGKFLGKDFTVMACYGHVRDLPRKGIAVDREHGYTPTYEILPGKERTVADLRRAAKGADTIYLAADPDREGEAICWHLQEILKAGAPKAKFHRAEFHEITKSAVTRAVQNPGVIDQNRVNAQQARRIIDRLVGYEVSDLLWSKVWRGLSAGRVQTVTLRIIVERESERDRFVAVPYFSVPVTLKKGDAAFPARVVAWKGEKLRFDGTDPRLATAGRGRSRARPRRGLDAGRRQRRREGEPLQPAPAVHDVQAPAGRRALPRVQRPPDDADLAAALRGQDDRREGLDRPHHVHAHGLDAHRRGSARGRARLHRKDLGRRRAPGGGPPLPPEEGRAGRARGDPPDVDGPAARDVARYVSPEELKLYRLIWNRFVASQMSVSLSEITTVEFEARRPGSPDLAVLRATGSVLKDAGWLRVYEKEADAGEDETPADGEEGDAAKVRLPALAEGDAVAVAEAAAEGHETQPPPRFNEASLVKFLEENGIGRPSTYAEILRKIEDREYVRKKDRRFTPTPLGQVIVDLMREGFDDFFQTEYTARMEEELDEVEEGKLDWRKALAEFDGKFVKDREKAKKKMVSLKAGLPLKDVRTHFTDFKLTNDPGDTCPKTGHALKLRMGKAGLFIACSGYPDCDFTLDIPEVEEDPIDATELEGQTCEECGSAMKLRTGKTARRSSAAPPTPCAATRCP